MANEFSQAISTTNRAPRVILRECGLSCSPCGHCIHVLSPARSRIVSSNICYGLRNEKVIWHDVNTKLLVNWSLIDQFIGYRS